MTQDTKLQQLVINKLTTAQYNSAVEAGTIDPNQLYMTTDSVTISDIKVNGVSVVDGEEADITLGTWLQKLLLIIQRNQLQIHYMLLNLLNQQFQHI